MIYLNIRSVPETLDPQLAESDEELMICLNLYEGLLRKNKDGKIVEGACKSYKKDGLIYTFDLRQDAKWSNDEPLIADDFVYAFRRAVSPSIKSPFARRLKSIKNASSILAGSADPSTLGVSAVSDKTLKIELSENDAFFEETLTTPLCMPCSQSFLEGCEGKYGRDGNCVISNGSYYLRRWLNEDFSIRLTKNSKYSGDFEAKNGGIVITANTETPVQKLFSKDSIDCALVDNYDLTAVEEAGAKTASAQNICWFMTIGSSYSQDVRTAFLCAINTDLYKSEMPVGFSPAHSIYPEVCEVKGADGAGITAYDIENAKRILSSAVKQTDNKAFPSATMYYYSDQAMLPVIKAVVAHFQQNLSAFINISPAKHPEELKNELKSTSLQFAIFPVKARNRDVSEYLISFGSYSGVDPVSAQTRILANKTIVPICYENTNFCYSQALKNVYFENRGGYVDFSFIVK